MERREAQLEHAKRAEAELLGQAKDGKLEDDSIEDMHFEQTQLFESAEHLDSSQANGELPASEGSFVPEPRTIEPTADQQGQVAEVPCELQGTIQEPTDHSENKEAVDETKATNQDHEISTKAGGVKFADPNDIHMYTVCVCGRKQTDQMVNGSGAQLNSVFIDNFSFSSLSLCCYRSPFPISFCLLGCLSSFLFLFDISVYLGATQWYHHGTYTGSVVFMVSKTLEMETSIYPARVF